MPLRALDVRRLLEEGLTGHPLSCRPGQDEEISEFVIDGAAPRGLGSTSSIERIFSRGISSMCPSAWCGWVRRRR